MPLTEYPIGEGKPKSKVLKIALAIVFGAAVVSFLFFAPGPRDFIRAAGSIFSRSLSDTFSTNQFGKLSAEIDLQAENFSAAEEFSWQGETRSDFGGATNNSSSSVSGRQNITSKTPEPKAQKNYEERKPDGGSIPSSNPSEIVPKSGFGSGTVVASSEPASKNILIAEVRIAGASTTNDFIKIYNTETFSVDMSGWKLKKKTNSGKEYSIRVFPDGSLIPARGIFLWANSQNNFAASVGADVSSAEAIAADNSIALFDSAGVIADAVAWGSSTRPYVEEFPYPINPPAKKNLARKFSGGAMQDTNNNSADFEIR